MWWFKTAASLATPAKPAFAGYCYTPPLWAFFDTYWLNSIELWICIGVSALVFVWLEAEEFLS